MRHALVGVILVVLASGPAVAQVTHPPEFDQDDESFGGFVGDGNNGIVDDPEPDGGSSGDTGSSDDSLYPFTERVMVSDDGNGPGCEPPATRLATWEVRTVWGPGPDDWTLEGWEHYCSDDTTVFSPYVPPGGAVGGGAPAQPAPPPTDLVVHAAIRELLPAPAVRLAPDEFGVTGLATWFWFEHDDPSVLSPIDHDGNPSTPPVPAMTASASDSGYTIAATVWVDEYRWELADGTVLRSRTPGSAEDPAAEHAWRTAAPANEVTIVARWTGTYSWATPGASGSGSMGFLDVATDAPYPIREIRAVPADAG